MMSIERDAAYFAARAAQEWRMAEHSADDTARATHAQLALQYERKAGTEQVPLRLHVGA